MIVESLICLQLCLPPPIKRKGVGFERERLGFELGIAHHELKIRAILVKLRGPNGDQRIRDFYTQLVNCHLAADAAGVNRSICSQDIDR